MKRFYQGVAVSDDLRILLDGRPVNTPARVPLILPNSALAGAVAQEWREQAGTIDPRTMPLTGLANAAIDRVAPDPAAFAAPLAAYAETDVLIYRADDPPALVERENAAWDPILAWARQRYDVHFELVAGIVHRAQPAQTVTRLAGALSACDVYRLAGMAPLVTIGGSLIAALAVLEGALAADDAFDATHVDETWQAEQWGEEPLAVEARELRRKEYLAAARFIGMLAG